MNKVQPTDKEIKIIHSAWSKILSIFAMAVAISALVFAKTEYNPVVRFYTPSGVINQPTRVWDGIITVTNASAQSVDISSAGFTSINSVTVTAANNTTTLTSMPIVSVKSYTTTSVVFNTLVSNSAGIGILAGLIIPVSVTGMQVHVRVDGW